MKHNVRKMSALVLALAVLFCVSSSAIAMPQNHHAVYYENTEFFRTASLSETNAVADGEVSQKSWATFDINASLTIAELQVFLNGYTYDFTAYGSAQEAGAGYVGLYQGYIVPAPNDTILRAHQQVGEPGVLVSVDAVFSGGEVFFTLVIGVISETNDPIVKAFGAHTNALNEVSRANINKAKASSIQGNEFFLNSGINTTRTLNNTVKYQLHADYFDSNGNSLGQISLFHADELRNDGDTPVHLKLTTNHANLISYARNYFNLGIDDIIVVYPTQIEGSIESNNSDFNVNVNAYEPQNDASSYNMSIPYLSLNPLLPIEDQMLEVGFWDIIIPLSSSTVTLSNGRQKVSWLVRHSYGITGTHGDYTTNSGFSLSAEYGYHGENASTVECYLTGRANMGFTVYVEEPLYEIFHQYTFTTRNTSLLSPVSVLP